MQISSDTGQEILNDAEQYAAAKAENGIQWIDGLHKRLYLLLVDGTITHGLDITKADAVEALDHIEEILGDLFHKERHRLMDIAGYRPCPTNPQTLEDIGRPA